MPEPARTPGDGWDRGWERHKLEQLRRLIRLSLAEKLRWLEQAQGLARNLTDRRAPEAVREPGPAAGK